MQIIPWIDLSRPTTKYPEPESDTTLLDHFVAGWESWSRFCDEAWVTTRADALTYLYHKLIDEWQLPVAFGVKTSCYIPGCDPLDDSYDFADQAAWQLIAAECKEIANRSGNCTVILDNEGGLKPVYKSKRTIHPARLTLALTPLKALSDDGIPLTFNLPNVQSTPREHSEEITRVFADVLPSASFLTAHRAEPRRRTDAGQLERHAAMVEIVGEERIVPRVYVRPSNCDSEYYSPIEAVCESLIDHDGIVSWWTGKKWWRAVPEEIVAMVTGE